MAKKLSKMTGSELVEFYRKQKQKNKIGLSSFETDFGNIMTSISGINGWRSNTEMDGYISSVSSMLDRANAYRNYYLSEDKNYDSSNIDKVIERLTGARDWLSERSDVFGGYGSAEDYDAAVKKYTDAEAKYGGKSSSELKALMESYKISRDAKNRDIDDQITALKGFLDENRNYLGRAIIPSEAFQKEFGLSDEDFANIYDLGGYLQKVGDVESKVKEKIAALESSRLAKDDAVAQHYYYQALLEELGAKGYSSALRGDYGSGLDRAKNFDYAVRAGADEIGKLVAAQRAASGGSVDFDATGYGELSDDEKSLYLYLADNVGEKAAREYYDYLFGTNSEYNEALAARVGRSASENKSDFERILGSFGSGLNSWIAGNERALKALFGKDDSVVHSFEYEAQFDREALSDNKALTALYDVGTSFGQMAPSVLAGFLTAGQSTGVQLAANVGTFGVSIYGNAYDEALKLGKDRGEAITYGILNAASEVALQNLIGGIPGVGKHLSGEFLTELANKTSSVLLKVAAQVAGDALGEFTEEYLQEVLGQVFRNVAFGENGEVKLFSEEALYSGIIGALTSAGISVPSGAVNLAGLNSVGKLYNVGASETLDGAKKTGVAALIEEGLAADRSSEAYDYAERLSRRQAGGKAISNLQAGTLAQLLRQASGDGKSDADTSFSPISKKNSTKDMHFTTLKLGDVLASLETGKDDPASVVGALGETVPSVNVRPTENVTEDAKDADRLLTENLEKYKGTMDRRFENYGKIQALWDAASGENSGAVASEAVSVNEREAEDQNASEGKNEGSREVSDGLEGVREDVDTVRRAADSGDSAMAAVYEKYNAELSDRERQNADVFVSDYKLVRDLAAGGRSEAGIRSIIESGNGAGSSLNDEQFLSAYHEGQALYEASGVGKSVDMSRPRRVGKVFYKGAQAVRTANGVLSLPDSGISRNSRLNEDQRAAVDFAEKVLAPMGVDVVFYRSGTNRSLPNGLYDGKYIYIDIEAGMSERASETFVRYALAHELTHLAERMSPELWQRYADAVLSVLSREDGVSVTRLIADKKNEYEKARIETLRKTYPEKSESELRDMVEPLTDDGAIRELVADASQLIFTRESRFAEKLAEKDATLWDKLKKLVLDAIDKLKKVLQGIPRDGVSEHIVGHLDELREYFDDMMADALYRAGHGTAEENDFFEKALEKGQEKGKSQATGKVQFKFRGYAEDGKGIYESNFPKGTPKAAKSEKILDFIQNVWSKQPIPLVISNGESSRSILAQFDPTIDRSQNVPTDASKLAGGNRHGNHTEQRVTLDLADDYYQIASESTYNYSKEETGKDSATHSGVKMWHYFVNDIYFMDQGSTALIPYTVTINVKEKQSGDFVYSFNAEQTKESSTRRTLHADVNTRKGANGELFIENITEGNMGQAIIKNAAQSLSDVPTNSIPQKQDLSTENSEVSENSDMQSQERRVDPDTDRQMLARALEGAAKSEADRGIVKDYAERLGKYRDMQKQLNDIRKEIDEKLEAVNSGAVHKSELNPLYNRANLLEEKLRSEDAKLLRMEALAPLHNLVEAERAKAREAEQAATREKVKSEKRLEAQKQAMENRQAANKRKAEQRKLRIQYLARAERAISRLYRWTAHPTKKDHVPTELLPYVKSLFEAVDVSHQFARIEKLEEQLAAQRQRIRELQDSGAAASVIDAQEAYERDLVERIRKLEGSQHNVSWADRLEGLKKIMSSVEGNQDASQVYVDFAPGLAEDIERQLDTFTDKGHVRLFDAKPEDIRFYAEAIESIAHSITEAGRLYANKRAASVEVLAELSMDEFKKETPELMKPHVGANARGLYGIDSLSPAYFAHKMGRGAEAVFGGLFDGFYDTIGNVRVINEFSDRLREKYKVSSFTGKNNRIHRIQLEQGGAISLTTTQLMTVYALSDRPQAQKHMFGRGIQSYQGNIDEAIRKIQPKLDQMKDEVERWRGRDADVSEFSEMLLGSVDIHQLTQKDVDSMIGELSGNQLACVKEIKAFLRDVIAPMGNKTTQTLYLYDMFTEDNYFPIESVKSFLRPRDSKDMTDGNIDTRSIFAVLNQGFTKSLSEKAGNPIVIRDIFDVFMDHCFGMANYGGLGVAVSDTIKWLSYRQAGLGSTLQTEMEKAWGKNAGRYIKNLLMSIEGELKGSDGARVINKLVRNAKIASVAGNMRVVLQQPTAYFRAASVLSPKAMLNASIHPFDLKKMIKEAEEHSELMYYKSLGFYDMNNSQSLLEKMKGDTSMADRIREWSTAPAGAADMMTWGTLWRACRLEVDAKIKADKLGVEKNSEKYFRMVRDKFHEVINLTQVIDSPMHKNKLMSDPDSLMKQLTAFMAEPMLTLNMVQSAVDDVFRKRPHAKVKLARASAVFLVSTAATSLMSALADAARDDDEDEGWLEKYFEAALRSATGVDLDGVSLGEILSGDWNLLNNMPIIKEIFSMLEGYDPSRMELSGIGKMVTAMTKLVKLLSGEGGDLEKTMYSVAQAISTVTGIPVSNLWRLVRSMVNTVKAWAQ